VDVDQVMGISGYLYFKCSDGFNRLFDRLILRYNLKYFYRPGGRGGGGPGGLFFEGGGGPPLL
jgi:hypothetical protein